MTDDLDLVVVGGGIAGLVVALEAAEAGASVAVLESDDQTGGMLRRGRLAGVDIDLGAESFATRTDAVPRLIADFALGLEVVSPRSAPARLVTPRFAGRFSRMPLPRRTVIGIPADPLAADVVAIVGERAARRAVAEVRTLPIDPAASLAELVSGRLGSGLVERLVDPLCRSVYSQPADAAPLSRLHPKLWAEFVRTGSLLSAADAVAPRAAGGAAVGGIAGGMWRLAENVRAAAVARGVRIRTGVSVRSLRSEPGATVVEIVGGDILRAAIVVVATGPRAAASLLGVPAASAADSPGAPAAAPAPGVRLLTAVVTAPGLAAEPVGSGVIVAPAARTAAKALTHIDAKWEWVRAALPPGTHLVRLSARDAEGTGLDSASAVARELRHLTGAHVDRSDIGEVVTTRWRDAVVPAATPAWTAAVEGAAARGIHVVGAVAAGTGLASVIPHARSLARDILSHAPVRKEPS